MTKRIKAVRKKVVTISPFDYEVTRKQDSISLKPVQKIVDPFKKKKR